MKIGFVLVIDLVMITRLKKEEINYKKRSSNRKQIPITEYW